MKMQEGFRIDKNLTNKLDGLLKDGSLDREIEILKILETLSEKLNSLEAKKNPPAAVEEDKEKKKNRMHRAWGQSSF
jgi:hypothetical protein